MRKKCSLKTKFLFLFFLLSLQLSAMSYSQSVSLSLSLSDALLTDVLSAIRNQSNYTFVYNMDDVRNIKVSKAEFKNAALDEILDLCLKNTGFSYVVEDNVVVIRKQQTVEEKKIVGVVKDKAGVPLPGVTVLIKGSTVGTATDAQGKFSLAVANLDKVTLLFSFVGMKTKEVAVDSDKPLQVVLEEDATEMDEVVVNAGYFQKTKESFTGSEVTVKVDELKR